MDDIKPPKSVDGMVGPDSNSTSDQQSEPLSGNGFNPQDQAVNNYETNRSSTSNKTVNKETSVTKNYIEQAPANSNVTVKNSSSKGLKAALTIFIILFLAATGAAAYLYMQQQNDKEVTVTSVDVEKLEQENKSLKYDNADLQNKNNQFQITVKSLTTTAEQLKSKCGNACKAINIPQ